MTCVFVAIIISFWCVEEMSVSVCGKVKRDVSGKCSDVFEDVIVLGICFR